MKNISNKLIDRYSFSLNALNYYHCTVEEAKELLPRIRDGKKKKKEYQYGATRSRLVDDYS